MKRTAKIDKEDEDAFCLRCTTCFLCGEHFEEGEPVFVKREDLNDPLSQMYIHIECDERVRQLWKQKMAN